MIRRDVGIVASTLKTPSKTVGISKSLLADGGEIKFREAANAGNITELKRQILRNLAQDFRHHSPIANKIGTMLKPRKAILETTCKLIELLSTKGALLSNNR
jgi:hypothetical protein